ncbi:coniferin beta-glucosidase-like [Prosopis cineraria]|uniref:coniferin beta-glucosidase-like n=1 Tax=Prosopis cineraria TaxID=364024 RepID=UPI00240ECACA|nr:coniferin beta-glucosidase-like [Prosopis cineraria]
MHDLHDNGTRHSFILSLLKSTFLKMESLGQTQRMLNWKKLWGMHTESATFLGIYIGFTMQSGKDLVSFQYSLSSLEKVLWFGFLCVNLGRNGVKVKGYMYWTVFDDFEWGEGYVPRYGLYCIDFQNDLKRIPKLPVQWYRNFLTGSHPQSYSIQLCFH